MKKNENNLKLRLWKTKISRAQCQSDRMAEKNSC